MPLAALLQQAELPLAAPAPRAQQPEQVLKLGAQQVLLAARPALAASPVARARRPSREEAAATLQQ